MKTQKYEYERFIGLYDSPKQPNLFLVVLNIIAMVIEIGVMIFVLMNDSGFGIKVNLLQLFVYF